MSYTLDQKILATNKACEMLEETKRVLQKAFKVAPVESPTEESLRQAAKDICGQDIFG